MGKRSKLYKAQLEKFDKAAQYQLAEAVKALKLRMPERILSDMKISSARSKKAGLILMS